ncbi:MAG: DUF1573 domain-containing protein [Dysgonamonadaceae bacterium]|jgi:hypothetical protein|nr:DUF1573 domain-containing protein [Dysgonamonadaceae bacterium]
MNNVKISLSVLLIFVLLLCYSCKENRRKKDAEQFISEWFGKEILFQDNFQCSWVSIDTVPSVCSSLLNVEYKILLYIDSTGCTSCKLHLLEWKRLIEEVSIYNVNLSFLFFFHPQDKQVLQTLLKHDRFTYPVFIDQNNMIDRLNHFPSQPEFQCFLLDKDNKVLLIGNPVLNPKIWELYKQTITGKKDPDNQSVMTVAVAPEEIEIADLSVGKKSYASFKIKNTGKEPFIIHRVDASCGCTVPVWEKQPVEPGRETEIRLEIQPKETGVFHKTVSVYGNVKDGVITVAVKGTAK